MDAGTIREVLSSREHTDTLVAHFISQIVDSARAEPESTEDYIRVLQHGLEASYQSGVERIYSLTESPIERIFLLSLALSFLYGDPLGLMVTPSSDDAPGFVKFRREAFAAVRTVQEMATADPKRSVKGYIAWLQESGQIGAEEAEFWHAQDIVSDIYGDAFHLTPQACFPDIRVDGHSVRADILLWVPARPQFQTIVECDGYEYHSSQDRFTSDRRRDRVLKAAGYDVLRFSGQEIFHHPAETGIEFYQHLQAIREGWNSESAGSPPS
jgi:restriction endonuclease-like protein